MPALPPKPLKSGQDRDQDGDIDLGDDAINDLNRDGRIDAADTPEQDLDRDNDIDAQDHALEEKPLVGSALGLSKSGGSWQKPQGPSLQVNTPRLGGH